MDSLHKVSDVENLNENEAADYIRLVLKLLDEKDNVENEKALFDLISRLSNSYFDYQSFLERITHTLIENRLSQTAYNIFTFLIQSNKFQGDLMDNLLNALINYSDYSMAFAESISSSPLINSLIDCCIENQEYISNKDYNDLFLNIITVINNVARNPAIILVHDIVTFKKVLMNIIRRNSSDKLGVISVLTLSYIIQETEIGLLDKGVDVVGIILNKITSVNPVDHRSGGFTVIELINGLRCLSANDNVKLKIRSENGIPLLLNILSGNNDEEKELALRIIWNLCFNQSIKEYLKTECKLGEVIGQFIESKNQEIKKNCDGISWLLNGRDEKKSILYCDSSKTDQLAGCKFDVFISYSREYKEIISKIKNVIIGSNFRVWIDDEQMFGDTLEAMANGIENSRIFIMAMSKAYTESPNCRCEAEYAFKLRKPIVPVVLQLKYKPMSWLGFIVGLKMYYEFSERRNPEETLSGIVKSIRYIMEGKEEVNEVIEQSKATTSNSELERKPLDETVRKWKKSDVMEWLKRSEMGHLQKSLKDLDGSLLEVLVDLRLRSPEYFNNSLKHEFGLKLVDVLKFHRAVNSLVAFP